MTDDGTRVVGYDASSASCSSRWRPRSVAGVRVLLVHAKDEHAAALYRHDEFDPSPIDDLTMMLLVKDIAG